MVEDPHPFLIYWELIAMVWQAEDGVGIPEDVLNDTRFERAMRFYFVYLRLDWLWSLNLFALILLNFLEVSYENGTHLLHCTGKRLKSCKSHYGHVLSCFFCISEASLVPGIFSTCLWSKGSLLSGAVAILEQNWISHIWGKALSIRVVFLCSLKTLIAENFKNYSR